MEGGKDYHEYRAIHLMHLASIPLNVRSDQGSLAKMRTVLRGLYNAKVDLAYLVAGIYHPQRLGIVQCYGAVGRARQRMKRLPMPSMAHPPCEAGMRRRLPPDDVSMRWIPDVPPGSAMPC